ncbi:MAG: hypothetical protein WDM78_17940 [Puia sp.]
MKMELKAERNQGKGWPHDIQHPDEAIVAYMPLQASYKSRIDEVLDTEGITRYLISLIPA